jgi:tetratricopeptide (TPR) repeat protein
VLSKLSIGFLIGALFCVGLQGCDGAAERRATALQRGQQYLAEANYAKARIEFSNALQIEPNDADARYYVAFSAEKLNDLRAAAQGYQATLNVDETHALALAALGRLYVFSGLAEQALTMVEKGLAVHPDHPELLVVRAAAEVALGREQDAFDDASKVIAADPNDEYAVALLAGIYRNRGERDRAVELVAGALERLPDSLDLRAVLAQLYLDLGDNARAEEELRRIVDLRPKDLPHRQRLVAFYAQAGKVDLAEAELRKVIELDPTSVDYKIALVSFLANQRSFDVAEAELKSLLDRSPSDAKLRIASGQFYEAHNLPEDGERAYLAVIAQSRTNPDGLAARDRLAALRVRGNRVAEAKPLIDEVLKENPRDNDALVLHSALALAEGRALDAITDLRAVLRDQPNSAPVLRTLARAHAQNNEPDLARENYRRAIEADPGNTEARVEYAAYLHRLGSNDEARVLLDAALKAEPNNLSALENQFSVLGALKDLAGAADIARRVVEAQPESPLGYFMQGVVRETSGDSAGAIQNYEASLAKNPRGAEPLGALARVLVTSGRRADARARLERVVTEIPDHSVALNLLAEIMIADRELDRATELADRAIQLDKTWWLPYRTKALAQLAGGAKDQAKSTYQAGLENTGNSPALGMDLAMLYERDNEPERAIQVYEAMHGTNPASEPLANNLAMLLTTYREDAGSIEKASELVRRFRDSDNPAYLNTYGWVRYRQGQFGEAVTYLRRASEAVPNNAIMHYHLGMALLKTGDTEQARAELEKAANSTETFPGKDAAQKALDSLPRA